MGESTAEGEPLFRRASDEPAADDHVVDFDNGREAMHRLRFPFEPHPADVLQHQHKVPAPDEEHGR